MRAATHHFALGHQRRGSLLKSLDTGDSSRDLGLFNDLPKGVK